VLIGTREEQFAWIECNGLVRIHVKYRQRHATVSRGGNEVADVDLWIET
jgi:hypothetical protein